MKKIEQNSRQLSLYIQRIAEINSSTSSKAILATTQNEKYRTALENKITSIEKLSIVRLARELLEENPDIGGFASYSLLANELMIQGDNLTALNFSRSALQYSRTKPEQIESMNYIAFTLFLPGETQDFDKGRSMFQKSIALSRLEKSHLRDTLVLRSLSDLIVAEARFGSCAFAKEALLKLKTGLSSSNNSSFLIQFTENEISFRISCFEDCTLF